MSGLGWAIRAEWSKLRTVVTTPWLLVAAVVGMVAVGVAATGAVNVDQCPTPADCHEDTAKLSLTGVWLAQAPLAALAALAVAGEYGTGMITPTLTAVPRRTRVLLAKAVVVLPLVLGVGALGVLGAVGIGRLVLLEQGFTAANGYPALSLADGPTFRAAAGTVLYLGLVALLGMGVGALVRDPAAAITGVMFVLYGWPVVAQFITDPTWRDRFDRAGPMTAGLSIQATRDLDQLAIQPWPGLGVLAAYTLAALLAGTARLLRD